MACKTEDKIVCTYETFARLCRPFYSRQLPAKSRSKEFARSSFQPWRLHLKDYAIARILNYVSVASATKAGQKRNYSNHSSLLNKGTASFLTEKPM